MFNDASDRTTRPFETAELQDLVLESLAQLNRSRTAGEQLEVSPTAPIFGDTSPLDSLGLVALLIEIEERLADRGMSVTLATERALSRTRSPFRDVPTLLAYLQERPDHRRHAWPRPVAGRALPGPGRHGDRLRTGRLAADPRTLHARVPRRVRRRRGERVVRRSAALINNAGIASMNLMALTPIDVARRIIETNFLGTFLFTQSGVRLLRAAKHPRIVNISTVAVPLALEGEAVYAASKSAVETFTRVTARELGQWGITCNAVGPSPVRTDLTRNVPEQAMAKLIARQAVPRWAEPADVVNVVDFFLRPDSGLVTGQVVYLGGVA
jgi:3-oxoacyl-[acyl-carrier protein] reductase